MDGLQAHFEARKLEEATTDTLLRSTIEFAHGAIKGATLLNGGAAVALLAFLGATTSRGLTVYQWAATSLGLFAIGTALAVLCGAFSYLAQYFFTQGAGSRTAGRYLADFPNAPDADRQSWQKDVERGDKGDTVGTRFQIVAIFVFFASIALFFAGVYSSYRGFSALAT